jgi:hypothetical protein
MISGVNVDYTITIGNMIEIGSIVIGGFIVFMTLRYDVRALKSDTTGLKVDFTSMQSEIKKLGDILINLADIRGEIKGLTQRVFTSEQDIRELRHGDGFIQKSNRPRGNNPDGEYGG